ncbi:MAG: Fpg/Nei family DNA glycosylase, partial [Cutibacterium acnes]|nr:Fpg/Nei family DNA glycosylase [Cutibacterium acnes]
MKLSCLNSLRLFDFHDAMTTYPRGQPTVPEGHVIH